MSVNNHSPRSLNVCCAYRRKHSRFNT